MRLTFTIWKICCVSAGSSIPNNDKHCTCKRVFITIGTSNGGSIINWRSVFGLYPTGKIRASFYFKIKMYTE